MPYLPARGATGASVTFPFSARAFLSAASAPRPSTSAKTSIIARVIVCMADCNGWPASVATPMAKVFEELDYQPTPLGEVSLRRKHIAMLGGLEVYEVMLGEAFLMSSLFHAVEDAVADLGLAELAEEPCDVIVGGLGLGYTAVAALAHRKVRSLSVVEYLQPVIGWHQRGMVPMGAKLTADERCTFVHGDFFALAQSTAGFVAGRKFHAVLLDIDHSPCRLLDDRNA